MMLPTIKDANDRLRFPNPLRRQHMSRAIDRHAYMQNCNTLGYGSVVMVGVVRFQEISVAKHC